MMMVVVVVVVVVGVGVGVGVVPLPPPCVPSTAYAQQMSRLALMLAAASHFNRRRSAKTWWRGLWQVDKMATTKAVSFNNHGLPSLLNQASPKKNQQPCLPSLRCLAWSWPCCE